MAEEKLIIIEEDALNAVGFRIDDIKELEYELRQSGPGTVQILKLTLADRILTFTGTDATTLYGTIQDSFSEGGVDASPQPIEVTQAAILTALELFDNLATALSTDTSGPYLRVGTDGTPITVTVV